eukprot:TRINITY_DN81436_c0_g1_i1.p1 TRINITY_DN81436_c0_g1~~TRINITY_DN81436_c0_g1_i1.p1  ORF type:complete len:562 (+),score=189.22 TRINITY_DN81436_c0_g1_i1:144-1688(+)
MSCIASIHLAHKELDQALRAAQDALESSKAAGDRTRIAKTLKLLAQIRLQKEEPGEALKAAEEACTFYRNQPYETREGRSSEIVCMKAMVDANAMMGSIDEAARIAAEAQRRFHGLEEKKGEATALVCMGNLHLMRKETEDAMNCFVQAPPLFLAVGDKLSEGEAWQRLAQLHLSNGRAGNALKAAAEASLCFKKQGDKKSRASASQLVADIHFALASVGAGKTDEALSAAQEAVSLYQDIGEKRSASVAMHVLANAQLMSQSFEDALKTAQDAELAFKGQKNLSGEAGALLLQAGAYLGNGDFEECRRVAAEAADLFRSVGDPVGEDSVEEFLETVEGYQKNKLNREEFRGFMMRPGKVSNGTSTNSKRASRPVRKLRQISNISDIELIKADTSKESKITLAFFDGFESRSAGGQKPAPKASEDAASGPFAKGFPEVGEKEQVLYSVRWVQASAGKAGSANNTKKASKKDFTKDEDMVQKFSLNMDVPKENWGSCYGKTNRLFQAAGGGQRGV